MFQAASEGIERVAIDDDIEALVGLDTEGVALGIEGIPTHEFGVHHHRVTAAQPVDQFRQGVVGLDQGVIHQSSTLRPENAWARVVPSTYSSSPPSGTP